MALCTGLMGTVISSLWAVINIFTIETDADNRPFDKNPVAKYICGVLGILKYLGEIVFWIFLVIGFFTGTLTHYNLNDIGRSQTIQESYEKIVTPSETVYKTTQTSVVD